MEFFTKKAEVMYMYLDRWWNHILVRYLEPVKADYSKGHKAVSVVLTWINLNISYMRNLM